VIRKHPEKFLFGFTAAGALASLYGLKQHYAELGTSACNVGSTFSCDVVNKSQYSEILGFPVAAIGLIGYLVIGIVAWRFLKDRDPVLGKALIALCVGGLLFSLYLTYLEAFVLFAWCLICLASLSSIFGTTLTSMMVTRQAAFPKR
jgi:uncharacterized membrane protein